MDVSSSKGHRCKEQLGRVVSTVWQAYIACLTPGMCHTPAESMIFLFLFFSVISRWDYTNSKALLSQLTVSENVNLWSLGLSWNTLFWIGSFFLINMGKRYQLWVGQNDDPECLEARQPGSGKRNIPYFLQQGWPSEVETSVRFWFCSWPV